MRREAAALEHQGECGRHRVPDRDALVANELREFHGKGGQPIGDERDARAGTDRREDVEDGEVEMQRGMAGDHVVVTHGKALARPVDEDERCPMRDHHALGDTSRSRGVQDVREIGLAAAGIIDARRIPPHLAPPPHRRSEKSRRRFNARVVRHQDEVQFVTRRVAQPLDERCRMLDARDEMPNTTIANDVRESPAGRRGVDRNVDAPGLEDAEHGDDRCDRLRQHEADSCAPHDAGIRQ